MSSNACFPCVLLLFGALPALGCDGGRGAEAVMQPVGCRMRAWEVLVPDCAAAEGVDVEGACPVGPRDEDPDAEPIVVCLASPQGKAYVANIAAGQTLEVQPGWRHSLARAPDQQLLGDERRVCDELRLRGLPRCKVPCDPMALLRVAPGRACFAGPPETGAVCGFPPLIVTKGISFACFVSPQGEYFGASVSIGTGVSVREGWTFSGAEIETQRPSEAQLRHCGEILSHWGDCEDDPAFDKPSAHPISP